MVLPDLDAVLRPGLSPASRALLKAIIRQAETQHTPIYLVGGFMRDLILGRPSPDLDLVFEGEAIHQGQALVKNFGGKLVVHRSFGTAVWWLPEDQAAFLRSLKVKATKGDRLPKSIDLITARRETYSRPAALPTVQFTDIAADQFRRDFTINTLALRLDGPQAGRLLDPWGAQQDLKAGLLASCTPGLFRMIPPAFCESCAWRAVWASRSKRAPCRNSNAACPRSAYFPGSVSAMNWNWFSKRKPASIPCAPCNALGFWPT